MERATNRGEQMSGFFCSVCGSPVKGENIQLGLLDRDVYCCTNRHCHRSAFEYTQDRRLPVWVKMGFEYQKAV
jgi:hypothetical protein